MQFSDAVQSDVPRLVVLINAAYRGPGPGWTNERGLLEGPRTDAETMLSELEVGRYLVAREHDDGPIVACVHISEESDGVWYVGSLAVDAARQGSGAGAKILGEVERQGRNAGVRSLRMTVIQLRDQLIAWYERRGFVRTGATVPFPYDDSSVGRPLRDDLSLIVLEKRLQGPRDS